MKVLFVSSGNSKHGISPIVKAQGESLKQIGLELDYFNVVGKGLIGYLKNVKTLKKHLAFHNYDVIHAHYALCGLVAVLTATRTPVVCSYMGNDIFGDYDSKGRFKWRSLVFILISIIIQPFLKYAISKSENTNKYVFFVKNDIIPNGVDLSLFAPDEAPLSEEKRILFLGNPQDLNKNIKLLQDAVALINEYNIKIIAPYPVPHSSLPHYFNNADVFALCSIVEGSPNVVKEAMACNCPIVATDVGNVSWLFGDWDRHFISKHDARDFADKIVLALKRGDRTQGRQRIIELGLDSVSVAKRIERIYYYVKKR